MRYTGHLDLLLLFTVVLAHFVSLLGEHTFRTQGRVKVRVPLRGQVLEREGKVCDRKGPGRLCSASQVWLGPHCVLHYFLTVWYFAAVQASH